MSTIASLRVAPDVIERQNLQKITYPNYLEVNGEPTDKTDEIMRELGLNAEHYTVIESVLMRKPQASPGQYFTRLQSQKELPFVGKKAFAISATNWSNDPRKLIQKSNAKIINISFDYCIVKAELKPNTKYCNTSVFFRGTERDSYDNFCRRSTSIERSPTTFIEIAINNEVYPIICSFSIAENLFNLEISPETLDITSDGIKVGHIDLNSILPKISYSNWELQNYNIPADLSLRGIIAIREYLHISKTSNLVNIIKWLYNNKNLFKVPTISSKSGINKCYFKIQPFATQCFNEDPIGVARFYEIALCANRSYNNVKLSVVFNLLFGNVNSKEEFLQVIGEINEKAGDNFVVNPFEFLENHDIYKGQRKKALAATGNRAFSKLLEEFDSLKINEKQFPKISALIKEGKIPLSTFFRKSEQYFILNDNWSLWEEMLKRGYEEEVLKLANEVCGRTTYEKDLMSYFYFILHALPDYLKKHTGVKWTCSPKIVNSQNELEPPSDDGTGTRRQRSALTPIVDNDARNVIVPYASLAIGGSRGTTYCYSHTYNILTRGFSFNGNTCTVDVEEKLNGRDDYGLMFYTLTGSAQGRGYPSFLIIFERRSTGTHVHFHRTHPSRSKDGDYNPVHNWIRSCYGWMIGNVNKSLIKYQQGDLAFISIDSDEEKSLNFSEYVTKYDNHEFNKPVGFAKYEKKEKSNILGYVRLIEPTTLQHHEHEHILMTEGTYCLRQCRSWEANPQGVWSLRID